MGIAVRLPGLLRAAGSQGAFWDPGLDGKSSFPHLETCDAEGSTVDISGDAKMDPSDPLLGASRLLAFSHPDPLRKGHFVLQLACTRFLINSFRAIFLATVWKWEGIFF